MKADKPPTKLPLVLLLALRSLPRSETDATTASVSNHDAPCGTISGALTINPDWTITLAVKVHDKHGDLISDSTFPGVLVSKGDTVHADFKSGIPSNESG